MASTSELNRVTMVVLRYLRKPFFAIVLVYAVGITGMALIPGRDADGNPEYMNLFHSFYFFTYTATTTGFGEIPNEFTDEQRLWAIFCLYTGVIAWFYAIGSTVRLLQNPHFIQAVNEWGFARMVKRISDPFFIICGFGDTGSLLARGLSDHSLGAVVIDSDIERIRALALRDYTVKMPGLCADASVPKHLVDAGVQKSNCKTLVVLIRDEDLNFKIAIMAKFLNPRIRVICRSTSPRHEEHLEELEGVTVIDPFEIFAQLLSMAITHPSLHNLNSWLVRARNVELGTPLEVPTGDWIICGYGHMGQWLHKYMTDDGLDTVIIDPEIDEETGPDRCIRNYADRKTLKESGIECAAGVVACTDNDSDNLSILLSAQASNRDAFIIARQNDHENQLAFDAASVDLILQSSLTTARRILKLLISPLIQTLVDHLRDKGPGQTELVARRLRSAVGDQSPHLWRINLSGEEATATTEFLGSNEILTVGDLVRDPYNLSSSLSCVPLMIERKSEYIMLPSNEERVQHADEIVLCGTKWSEWLLMATLKNPYTLHYLVTGKELPRGYFFTWVSRKLAKAA
ncbi:MAG: Glutathione-regulated potassium-efflux system protein KefC [Gammaproteobacteria bacterium]|nr:Glutathione-regulated potassium-efflux system protein KefC [Gammaproteobacteria bacterium]